MLDVPLPKNVNSPPKIGEYCYYHSSNVKLNQSNKYPNLSIANEVYYICLIRYPNNELKECLVHYSTKEDRGSKPYITRHEGVLESIKKVMNDR